MKKILVLCRHDARPDYDQIETFQAGLESIDAKNKYEYGELEDVIFSYDGNELKVTLGQNDLSSYDGLFLIGWFKTKMLEDVALSVATYMNHHNVKVFNTEALYTRSRSKLSQYVVAALNGIPLTPFIFSMSSEVLRQQIKTSVIEYPVIMKAVQASRGNDNYLIENEAAALSLAGSINSDEGPWFVVQGFVPNDGDLRIVVMGESVVHIIHRQSQSDSHLNNTSKGGTATLIRSNALPDDIIAASIKLAKLLRREITGVDMIQHKVTGKYYLLEINNMPQLATGSMVQEKISALDTFFEEAI